MPGEVLEVGRGGRSPDRRRRRGGPGAGGAAGRAGAGWGRASGSGGAASVRVTASSETLRRRDPAAPPGDGWRRSSRGPTSSSDRWGCSRPAANGLAFHLRAPGAGGAALYAALERLIERAGRDGVGRAGERPGRRGAGRRSCTGCSSAAARCRSPRPVGSSGGTRSSAPRCTIPGRPPPRPLQGADLPARGTLFPSRSHPERPATGPRMAARRRGARRPGDRHRRHHAGARARGPRRRRARRGGDPRRLGSRAGAGARAVSLVTGAW